VVGTYLKLTTGPKPYSFVALHIYQSLHGVDRDNTFFTAVDSAAERCGEQPVQITAARQSGRGPGGPTMLHVLLSISVLLLLLLFADGTN